jgi:glucosamine--fructose-6-phosphate aminotransferase (isomerizing)
LLSERAAFAAVAARIRSFDPVGIVIAARGSSDNAALFAKYLFESRNRLPVALAAPSLYTSYRTPPRLDRHCVVAISQSGASPDIGAVVDEARRQGALTVAIVNDTNSALASAADAYLPLAAGPETSVPASKTYTASLLAVALLSAALAPDEQLARALEQVPRALAAALDAGGAAAVAAALDAPSAVVLGRGVNLATADEVALKLTETAYVLARGWSAADFAHGPIAIAGERLPALIVSAGGPAAAELETLAADLNSRGCTVAAITDGTRVAGATAAVNLESGLPEALSPLPLAVAGQLVAAALAERRGVDPDHPRALSKVTRTW